MPRAVPQDRWLADAGERFAALAAWRQAHPKATWAEIEAAVDAQLGPLRAQLLGDTALASDATDLGQVRPGCPECGSRLVRAGRQQRTLRGEGDEPIGLDRSYARCPRCGTGLFPLDEELGLLPGALTPTLQGHLSRLGSCPGPVPRPSSTAAPLPPTPGSVACAGSHPCPQNFDAHPFRDRSRGIDQPVHDRRPRFGPRRVGHIDGVVDHGCPSAPRSGLRSA